MNQDQDEPSSPETVIDYIEDNEPYDGQISVSSDVKLPSDYTVATDIATSLTIRVSYYNYFDETDMDIEMFKSTYLEIKKYEHFLERLQSKFPQYGITMNDRGTHLRDMCITYVIKVPLCFKDVNTPKIAHGDQLVIWRQIRSVYCPQFITIDTDNYYKRVGPVLLDNGSYVPFWECVLTTQSFTLGELIKLHACPYDKQTVYKEQTEVPATSVYARK